jgi:hypothetical protein
MSKLLVLVRLKTNEKPPFNACQWPDRSLMSTVETFSAFYINTGANQVIAYF